MRRSEDWKEDIGSKSGTKNVGYIYLQTENWQTLDVDLMRVARERRSQGRFQLFPRSLAGHGVTNKEEEELVSEMPSVTGQQSGPLGPLGRQLETLV